MTDRLKGVTVAFERDLRDDDAEAIISAISQIRCVAAVTPILSTPEDWMARQQVRNEVAKKLMGIVSDLYHAKKGDADV